MAEALKKKPDAESTSGARGTSVIIDGHYAPPPEDKDGKLWVRTTVLIQAEPDALYKLWREVEKAPLWQEQIVEVRVTGERTQHWVMQSNEKNIEWDSEIMTDEPGRRIAWRSIGGDLENAGEVVFEQAPGGRGTMVTELQQFWMGKLEAAWKTIIDRDPKQGIIESLRNFKALAEAGEIPRIEPRPHGPRGTMGELKKELYGEKIPVPQGTKEKISA